MARISPELSAQCCPASTAARFYPTKTPDLIGGKDRKYVDHTATHLLRGPEDLMRYAVLVSRCDLADFGERHRLTEKGRRILYRYPDELLYGLAQNTYTRCGRLPTRT